MAAGLKSSGSKDVAVVVNDGPLASAAGVFTRNRVKAAPVLWSQQVLTAGALRAVALNSGGANCYTGAEGFQTTHAVAERAAEHLGIGAIDVVVCSTGLIGERLPLPLILSGIERANAELSAEGGPAAAAAIIGAVGALTMKQPGEDHTSS
mgnify:CR=1 FL=1